VAAQNAKKELERLEGELKPLQDTLAQAKAKVSALEATATVDATGARKETARHEGELKPLQDALAQAQAKLAPLETAAKAAKTEADKLKAAADTGDAQAKAGLAAAQEKATAAATAQEGGSKAVREAQAAVTAKQKEIDAAKGKAGPATPGMDSAAKAVADAQAAVNANRRAPTARRRLSTKRRGRHPLGVCQLPDGKFRQRRSRLDQQATEHDQHAFSGTSATCASSGPLWSASGDPVPAARDRGLAGHNRRDLAVPRS
jgi:hypothetical protein